MSEKLVIRNIPSLNTRAVYWQESAETTRIKLQGLRYNIVQYHEQGDIPQFFLNLFFGKLS